MTTSAPDTSRQYDLGFARWVYKSIPDGDKMALCMQCGACAGSCPIGTEMDHGPRKLFMMVRAGMKDDVFNSTTLWNCTSCYRCTVRCPRGIPVTSIIQGLAREAVAQGFAPERENARFAKSFWWSTQKFGLTDERLVTARYYFSFGLAEGIKKSLENLKIAIGMIKTGRMHLTGPHKIKDTKGLAAMLAKAQEIEDRDGAMGNRKHD